MLSRTAGRYCVARRGAVGRLVELEVLGAARGGGVAVGWVGGLAAVIVCHGCARVWHLVVACESKENPRRNEERVVGVGRVAGFVDGVLAVSMEWEAAQDVKIPFSGGDEGEGERQRAGLKERGGELG